MQRRAQPVSPNRPVDASGGIAEILDVGIEGVAEEVTELGGRNGLTGFRQGADPAARLTPMPMSVTPSKILRRAAGRPSRSHSGARRAAISRASRTQRRPLPHGLELGHQTIAQVLRPDARRKRATSWTWFANVCRADTPAVLLHEANGFDEVDDEDDA